MHQGALGIKVTLGLLVADDVSVVRLLDRNSATATVTLRFLPTSVFRRFRAELAAILEAQGEALATEQIGGDNLAAAQFRRSNGSWHLEQIEPLGRSGAAFRKVAELASTPPASSTTNVAQFASVLVSSEDASAGRTGRKAIDGLIDYEPGAEWLAETEREGAWIRLGWNTPVRVWEVIVHGRVNPDESVRSGTLTFSDGSSIDVGELRRDGAGVRIPFSPRTITWLRFVVTSAGGARTGLAEIEVLGTPVPEEETAGLR